MPKPVIDSTHHPRHPAAHEHAGPGAVVLVLLIALTACRTTPPLPTRDWPGTRAALQVLADHAAAIESLSAGCGMTIRTAEDDTVTLDGVMILAQPDRMRVQAWKFDQRVFDLTVRDDEVWLWADDRAGDPSEHFPTGFADDASDGSASGGVASGGVASGGVASGGVWLGPLLQPFDADVAQIIEDDPAGGTLTVRWPIGDASSGWSWVAVIDRATITYRELRVLDPQQQVVQRLRLEDYRLIGTPGTDAIPWPMRLIGSGRVNIEMRLDEVELNPDLPDAAFEPPMQARKVR